MVNHRLTSALLLFGVTPACLERDVYTGEPVGIRAAAAIRGDTQPDPGFVDLLFVVDDSISMADKQRVLQLSLQRAAGYAVRCISNDLSHEMSAVNGRCPPGYLQTGLLPSVGSQGLITSSIDAGGLACYGQSLGAHLFPPIPQREVLELYGNQIVGQLSKVGQSGCGYEGPLEAMYRFLVDPEPPLRVVARSTGAQTMTIAEGIDEDLLKERSAFLHPFSRVVIVILTDEDDCSVRDSGDAWKVGAPPGLARGSSGCQSDPNGACCRSCDSSEVAPPRGCAPLSEDEACSASVALSEDEDLANLRCWDQRRRFGADWLFPVQRYVEALTSPTVLSRSGQRVANPLFANGRTSDMISVLAFTGVPWQLLTTPESLASEDVMEFLTPDALSSSDAWQRILGDPASGVPPEDAHLRSSVEPRPGLAKPSEPLDPIHGHEVIGGAEDELQYSCIFALPEPRDCGDDSACDCPDDPTLQSPLCRQADGSFGTVQRFAKAKPPTRILEFLRGLGSQAYQGSICPRQLDRPEQAGFGYSEAINAFHLGTYGSDWDLSCFYPGLPTTSDGTLKCQLLEFHESVFDCSTAGRSEASGPYVDAMLNKLGRADRRGSSTVCEIPPLAGGPFDPGTPAYACANEAHPTVGDLGYCYIDPDRALGEPTLVEACAAGHRRRVRLFPRTAPLPGTTVELICDYGKR